MPLTKPAENADALRLADQEILEIDAYVGNSNGELDLLETRLQELRRRGQDLNLGEVVKEPPVVQRGSVETLDLRALMTLREDTELTTLGEEDDDDEFGQRFKEFANADADLASRRWFEQD